MSAAAHDTTTGAVSTVALLLHPVRMRVVQAATGRHLTTRQLAGLLPDVPPATLYRQLAKLVGGGLLDVVATRRVRGATERTYSLRVPARVTGEELAGFSRDDHRRLFQAFVGALLADHRRYLEQTEIDLVCDSVSFQQTTLTLTDEETRQLLADLEAVVQAARQTAARTAVRDRRNQLVTLITMPAVMDRTGPPDESVHDPNTPA